MNAYPSGWHLSCARQATTARLRPGSDLDLGGQPDERVMDLAERDDRILISADTDFGELLANAPVLAPSVILVRNRHDIRV